MLIGAGVLFAIALLVAIWFGQESEKISTSFCHQKDDKNPNRKKAAVMVVGFIAMVLVLYGGMFYAISHESRELGFLEGNGSLREETLLKPGIIYMTQWHFRAPVLATGNIAYIEDEEGGGYFWRIVSPSIQKAKLSLFIVEYTSGGDQTVRDFSLFTDSEKKRLKIFLQKQLESYKNTV